MSASTATLMRRVAYGGRKGRSALRKLQPMETGELLDAIQRNMERSIEKALALPRGWHQKHPPVASFRVTSEDLEQSFARIHAPPPPVGPNEFRCDECGGVFNKGRTDEEAHEEERAIFGREIPVEERAVVCDPCSEAIMRRNAGIPGSVFAAGGQS